MYYAYFEYINANESKFFTMIALPEKDGKFPTVICRSPYVRHTIEQSESDVVQAFLSSYARYMERGYAVVFQHCKGCGKSTGDFVPYIHEREEGIMLREWIRKQSFYNGELFLVGGSYTASLHYATAPFEKDVKGAVFEVQDSERYRLWYRNGQMRKGHANWHFDLYKNKTLKDKQCSMRSFAKLPLKNVSEKVLGDRAEDFENMLYASSPNHAFWNTRYGGQDARDAVTNAHIPILLTTGYNDFYVGGMFKMWERMDAQTKEKSAFLVSPYDHGDGYNSDCGLVFPLGKRAEAFGTCYPIDWLDHVRKGTPIPYKKGLITYYRDFENGWESDFCKKPTKELKMELGKEIRTFDYDPCAPTAFAGEGLFANEIHDENKSIKIYTKPLGQDVFIKGQMKAVLSVSSNCADTSFYVRISIQKPACTYVLRHDVTSLSYAIGEYVVGEKVEIKFCFDEHAFLLKKGERLQVDIASTDDNAYVSHTNNAGEYALQTNAKIAKNTVYLGESYLMIPVELD